jgi:hypothetical protein
VEVGVEHDADVRATALAKGLDCLGGAAHDEGIAVALGQAAADHETGAVGRQRIDRKDATAILVSRLTLLYLKRSAGVASHTFYTDFLQRHGSRFDGRKSVALKKVIGKFDIRRFLNSGQQARCIMRRKAGIEQTIGIAEHLDFSSDYIVH